jgi:hypothetical protein
MPNARSDRIAQAMNCLKDLKKTNLRTSLKFFVEYDMLFNRIGFEKIVEKRLE